jgi:hypothetical protein
MVTFMAWFLFLFIALPIIINVVFYVGSKVFCAVLDNASQPQVAKKPEPVNEDPYLC